MTFVVPWESLAGGILLGISALTIFCVAFDVRYRHGEWWCFGRDFRCGERIGRVTHIRRINRCSWVVSGHRHTFRKWMH